MTADILLRGESSACISDLSAQNPAEGSWRFSQQTFELLEAEAGPAFQSSAVRKGRNLVA